MNFHNGVRIVLAFGGLATGAIALHFGGWWYAWAILWYASAALLWAKLP